VAVIQISRIQIRRGRENEGSGVPQLASGEFGWAVDSQKLYIGNGAVSEGSPYVGNTEVLTQHTNLFEYASTYTYRDDAPYIQTGATVNSPVSRTLQARLDDRVSVRAFGCPGDGTDQTAAFQRAIYQLFINDANRTNPQSRVVLYVEPGVYELSSTIYIPPYVTIEGAGPEKTVFRITGTTPAFRTVNGATTITTVASDSITTETNQAKHISMSGFTIDIVYDNVPAFRLENCTQSMFKDININGVWLTGVDFTANSIAIQMNALSTAVTTSYNTFENVNINGFAYGVSSRFDVKHNTFKDSKFTNMLEGFGFGETTVLGTSGQLTGPLHNLITNCVFDDIDNEAIRITNGVYNKSINNKFFNVGNEGGSSINPQHPVVTFLKHTNVSEGDWFQRSEELGTNLEFLFNVPFLPEVDTPAVVQHSFTEYVRLVEFNETTKIAKFPANSIKGIEIDYVYRSNQVQAHRSGVIKIVVDPYSDIQTLSDDYDYVGDVNFAENLKFSAQNFDEDGDTILDTVALMVLNSTSSDDADFYYRVRTKG
jgi:hypothetical protein